MRHTTILVAVLAFVPLASTTAQERPPVESGARIRVTAPGAFFDRIVVGTVVSWEGEQLVLDARRGTLTFPIDSIIKLEISRGKKSYVEEGAGIGLLVGAVYGYLACGGGCSKAKATALFAVPGVVLGAIVGAVASPTIWEEVPLSQLRVSFGPQRDGRFVLGASVRF